MTSVADIASPPRPRGLRLWRVAAAAVAAAITAGAGNALLAFIGVTVFSVPAAFRAFQPQAYIPLTVIGVMGAAITWSVIAAKARNPVALLHRSAVIVVAVSLLPDAVLLVTGNSVVGALMLMIMHVVVGVITYHALVRIAPPSSQC